MYGWTCSQPEYSPTICHWTLSKQQSNIHLLHMFLLPIFWLVIINIGDLIIRSIKYIRYFPRLRFLDTGLHHCCRGLYDLQRVECCYYHCNWLIDWCLTSSEQFFSYIQDDITIVYRWPSSSKLIQNHYCHYQHVYAGLCWNRESSCQGVWRQQLVFSN